MRVLFGGSTCGLLGSQGALARRICLAYGAEAVSPGGWSQSSGGIIFSTLSFALRAYAQSHLKERQPL